MHTIKIKCCTYEGFISVVGCSEVSDDEKQPIAAAIVNSMLCCVVSAIFVTRYVPQSNRNKFSAFDRYTGMECAA